MFPSRYSQAGNSSDKPQIPSPMTTTMRGFHFRVIGKLSAPTSELTGRPEIFSLRRFQRAFQFRADFTTARRASSFLFALSPLSLAASPRRSRPTSCWATHLNRGSCAQNPGRSPSSSKTEPGTPLTRGSKSQPSRLRFGSPLLSFPPTAHSSRPTSFARWRNLGP